MIFVTGRNKRAIEDHFDSNPELEEALFARGKMDQANMVRNIIPEGVECIFVRQPKQRGLGDAVLCSQRVVGDEPFALLLADDFILSSSKNTTQELVDAYKLSGKMQMSLMEVNGPEISNYEW